MTPLSHLARYKPRQAPVEASKSRDSDVLTMLLPRR